MPVPRVVPPPRPRPPPPAAPRAATTAPVLPQPAVPEPRASSSSTTHATIVPGFGCKGEGKAANYGVAIAPPRLLPPANLAAAAAQPSSSSGSHGGEAPPADPVMPSPIASTTEEVEEWVSTTFTKLTNISTTSPPSIGESVLWRGVKTGRRGNQSTKMEYFNGTVHALDVDDDGELYVYIT